jgi:hypothetical protein
MPRIRCDEGVDVTESLRKLGAIERAIAEESKAGSDEATDLLPLLRVIGLWRAKGSAQLVEPAAALRTLRRGVSRCKLERSTAFETGVGARRGMAGLNISRRDFTRSALARRCMSSVRLTRTLTGRGERMRASGPVERDARHLQRVLAPPAIGTFP